MTKRYFVEAYGCQMNVHDAERLAGLLEAAGYEKADSTADADLVVVNTCSVRERAEEKLHTRLGELRVEAAEGGRRRVVAVTGCVAQQEGSRLLARSPGIDVIIGTQSMRELPVLADRALASRGAAPAVSIDPIDEVSFPLGIARRGAGPRAMVTIIEGCNEFCAFCVVPYTRGHERMRPVRDIVAEVREVAAQGYREVQLLGQIVNHYQAPDEPSCDFAALLERVEAVDGIEWIRFASPHPRHVTPRLIEAIRDLPKVCKHLHLPVQSGSSAVLARMRRRHTREHYLELVGALRDAMPDLPLTTDVIVGFPGETPAQFEETLSLVEAVGYHQMYSFRYSPRPNTLALKRLPDDVTEEEKTRRIVALQQRQREIQSRLLSRLVGQRVKVLVDGESRRHASDVSGRTSGNVVVNFPGETGWTGKFAQVVVERSGPNSVWGRAVDVEQ